MAGDHSDTQGDFQDPALSRSAMGLSPFGKLDRELKTHIDDATYAQFLEKCARLGGTGMIPGVVLRELVYRFVHGRTLSELVAQRTAAELGEEGPIAAHGGQRG